MISIMLKEYLPQIRNKTRGVDKNFECFVEYLLGVPPSEIESRDSKGKLTFAPTCTSSGVGLSTISFAAKAMLRALAIAKGCHSYPSRKMRS